MAPRRARRSDVWEALADEVSGPVAERRPAASDPSGARRAVALGRRGRSLVSIVPLAAAFVLGEWFVLTDAASFAGLLSVLGVIVVSLLAGLLPVLLLVSSLRKGEYAPGTTLGSVGRPALLGAVYVLFVAALLAHGLVIWDDPAERVAALAVGVAMLGMPALLARGGAFARRVTLELRVDQRSGTARFALLAGGRRVSGTVRLDYADGERRPEGVAGEIPAFDSLRRVVFEFRDDAARPEEVKVWAHRVTPEGETESLAATALLRTAGHLDAADLSLSRGEAVFPIAGVEPEVEIALKGREPERD